MALKIRRGTASERAAMSSGDPAQGELIYETDTGKLYIGDGTTAGGVEVSGEINSVTSVFGRTGAVTAQDGDYDSDQVNEGSTNLYFTDARVSASSDVAANTAHRGTTTGNPHSVTSTDVGLGSVMNALQIRNAANSFTGDFSQSSSPTVNDMVLLQIFVGGSLKFATLDDLPISSAAQAALDLKQDILTFDSTPTDSSTNPVESNGVFDALAGKQDTLTFDSVPTDSSTNPVESNGVYDALALKADASHTHGASDITAGTFGSGDFSFQDSLKVDGSVYANYNHDSSYSKFFAHNGSSPTGASLSFDIANAQWNISHAFNSGGDYISMDGYMIAINTPATDKDSFIYFGHNGNYDEDYLMWDDSADKFVFSNDLKVTGTLEATNDVSVTDDLTVGDDLTVSGDASVSGDLDVTGGVTATSFVSDFVHLTKTSSSVQNVGGSNGTTCTIQWDSQLHYDSATFSHDVSHANTRITLKEPGRYSVKATVTGIMQTSGDNRITLAMYPVLNSTANKLGIARNYSRGTYYGDLTCNVFTEVETTSTNVILEIQTLVDDSDGNYTVNTQYDQCEVIVRRIG